MIAEVKQDTQVWTSRSATWGGLHRKHAAAGSLLLFLFLLIDGMVNSRAFFDKSLMLRVQEVDFIGLDAGISRLELLTSSLGAFCVWCLALSILVLRRIYSVAVALVLVPLGGLINEFVGVFLVSRTRPHLDELTRTSSNFEERSFPSGHTVGAMLIWGTLFVAAGRIANKGLRIAARCLALAVIVLTGPARVWEGAHWPTDVAAAYALGVLLLIVLTVIIDQLRHLDGLPVIRAEHLEHDESVMHAHALTSLVLFEEDRVSKIYAPGFLPRIIYWIAFQARFPYAGNRQALLAAMYRRNLAAMLTKFWYGESRVAQVREVGLHNGRLALTSERIVNTGDPDKAEAKAFLRNLTQHFDDSGLPTWQIDPRQPRAIDNVLQTAPGVFVVVDLESGLVSPLASLTYWQHSLRSGTVPFFDDIQFTRLHAYLQRQQGEMTAQFDAEWFTELQSLAEQAEVATREWHASEPRLFNRGFRFVLSGFGLPGLYRRAKQIWSGGNDKAMQWLSDSIDRWEHEGRLTAAQTVQLRNYMQQPVFQEVMPYLGGHILLSIPLRFPFGCIIRPLLVAGALTRALVRRMRGSIDNAAWERARQIHSPAVMVMAAIPGAGGLAYIVAKPVRSNRLLLRVLGDGAALKVPFHLYERSRMRRFVVVSVVVDPDRTSGRSARNSEIPMAA